MIDVINLALPFFGLIFLGYACGRFKRIPDDGLAWMNFFIVYVALPALFYRILAATPLDKLSQVSFIFGTTFSTYVIFALSFGIGFVMRRGHMGEATMAALTGLGTSTYTIASSNPISALEQGKLVVMATGNTVQDPGDFTNNHAYALLAYDASSGLFTLYNPWGAVVYATTASLAANLNVSVQAGGVG